METINPTSDFNHSNRKSSKLARTFQKVINFRTATKIASTNGIGICVLTSQQKFRQDDGDSTSEVPEVKQKAVMEALLAKVFASVTSIKAAYAELQMAQHPYNSDAIQTADEAVVEQLRALSELKRKFLKKELRHLSPQVTLMLADIQEQQSLMRTYEITIKKLESEVEEKGSDIALLHTRFQDCSVFNRAMEKKLNCSGALSSMFDNIIQCSTLNPSQFVQVLHCALRSVRSFVKMMIKEMELAKWDVDEAAKTIEPETVLANQNHRCFLFESFVCKTMLEGFNSHSFGLLPSEKLDPEQCFNRFNNLKSAHPKSFLAQNSNSAFAKFTRTKYLNLVHAKMECSFFGNLNQRKLITSGGFPDTAFFIGFAEMARRFWLLHCLGFSMYDQVSIFQVKKGCRFSEVYMENVSEESVFPGDIRVSFTVVPGFKIGKTVIQSQVYLSIR